MLPKITFLKINGLKQRIFSWGNPKRPPLFLLHGWMDTGASFHFLAEHLYNKYFMIAPDLRGYGISEHGKSALGYFFYEYLADLHCLLHHYYPKKKINLLGHSLGGAVATIYAASFPDRIKSLINLEGFVFQNWNKKSAPKRIHDWIAGMKEYGFRSYPSLLDLAQRLIKANSNLSEAKALFLAKYLSKKTKTGYRIAADPRHKYSEPYQVMSQSMQEYLSAIRAKTLVIGAEMSFFTTTLKISGVKKELQNYRRWINANCETLMIPEVGHMLHHEKPEEIAKILHRFLTN